MRLAITAILTIAAGVSASTPAPALAPAPFDGLWRSCEPYQGSEICTYRMLVQRGDRVCGVQRDFATNAYYEHRFVGTVKANVAHIEKICGDPGSETDTYCAGRAPDGAEKVGWAAAEQKLFLCNGRLLAASGDDAASCAGVSRRSGLPRVRAAGGDGPQPDDRAWLASCAAGAE
ncbi:MAG TPA: hypothetical protein VJM13_00960 [Sphingopyxis sp.]|nr:hypothetical protein [Sphingopyxis sp.]